MRKFRLDLFKVHSVTEICNMGNNVLVVVFVVKLPSISILAIHSQGHLLILYAALVK